MEQALLLTLLSYCMFGHGRNIDKAKLAATWEVQANSVYHPPVHKSSIDSVASHSLTRFHSSIWGPSWSNTFFHALNSRSQVEKADVGA